MGTSPTGDVETFTGRVVKVEEHAETVQITLNSDVAELEFVLREPIHAHHLFDAEHLREHLDRGDPVTVALIPISA